MQSTAFVKGNVINACLSKERKKPNILIIIIDDLGFNQVGFRAKPEKNYDVPA